MKAVYKLEIETNWFIYNKKEIHALLVEALIKVDSEKDLTISNLIEASTAILYQTTSEDTVCIPGINNLCYSTTKVFTINEVLNIINLLTPAPKSRWEKIKDVFFPK